MKKFILPFLFMIFSSCQTDLDDEAIQALLTGEYKKVENIDTIAKDDTLYSYLNLVAKKTDDALVNVGCIEFIYPFVLFQFDDENNYLKQVSVQGNENFAELLDNLQAGYSIGLSYPISGNLIDGTSVTVENNEQLQQSLETCIEQELEIFIGNCNLIATTEECIWKITESDPDENQYLQSFFTLIDDGSVIFSVLQDNQEATDIEEADDATDLEEQEPEYNNVTGTWIFYFIGPELHMNINFGPIEENEQGEILEEQKIKSDWNFDWKINYIDLEKIEIEKRSIKMISTENGDEEELIIEKITLEKKCKNNEEGDDESTDSD